MFEHTNLPHCPWVIIHADKKYEARIEALRHIIETIPYEVLPEDME